MEGVFGVGSESYGSLAVMSDSPMDILEELA